MLISRPLPFNHHCSPPFLAVLTDFHEIENKCVQTALSAIRHFRPDIYTLVIVFPLVIIFLLWQKKILGSIYQRIPNTRFELTGYILGTFFFYLSPFFLRPVLRATVNSLIWGLALFLMSWPHPFEMAVLMGLASLLPYWGIWFGFLFPLSILWHEPVQFTRLIEFVIAMAVLWLTNYLVTFFKTENPTKLSDKFFYLAYLSVAFILFNCDGLLGFGVLFSFATFLHPYLTNGIRLLRQPAVKS
jgi:predicted PurR-regulated permease PerM